MPVCGYFECMYVFLEYVFFCVCLFVVFVVAYYCVPCVLWLYVFCVCYVCYVCCVCFCAYFVCVFGGGETALPSWCLHSTRPGPRRTGRVRQGPVPRSAQHCGDDTGALTPVLWPRGAEQLGWGRRPRASIPGRVLPTRGRGVQPEAGISCAGGQRGPGFTSRSDYRPQMTDHVAAHSVQWPLPSQS